MNDHDMIIDWAKSKNAEGVVNSIAGNCHNIKIMAEGTNCPKFQEGPKKCFRCLRSKARAYFSTKAKRQKGK